MGLDWLQKPFLFHDAPHPLPMAIEAAFPKAPHIATKIRPLSMCCVSLRSTQPTILAFGPMLSVALNEHETQRQGEQQDTCLGRFKTDAALY